MENITRQKEVIVVVINALVTTAFVALARRLGSDVVAAFIAVAGTGGAIVYVIIANMMIKQARKK